MTVTAFVQSELMSHIEGPPIPDAANACCLNTIRGPLVFFINQLNRHLVVLKPSKTGGQEVLDLCELWKLTGEVISLSGGQGQDGDVHLLFAKDSTQEGLANKLFAIDPILPKDFAENDKWKDALREFSPTSELSKTVTIKSIAMESFDGISHTGTVVFQTDDKWRAIGLSLAVDEKDGLRKLCLTGKETSLSGDADKDAVPRALNGTFDGKSGIFISFVSKGKENLHFLPGDEEPIIFESPSDPVTSIQVFYDSERTGTLLVGTEKSLLLYRASNLTVKEKGEVDKSPQEADEKGDPKVQPKKEEPKKDEPGKQDKKEEIPLQKEETRSKEIDFLKSGLKDNVGDKTVEKAKEEPQKPEKEKDKAEAVITSVVIHQGPVSHLRIASSSKTAKSSVWLSYEDGLTTLGYFQLDPSRLDAQISPEIEIVPVVQGNLVTFSPSYSVDGESETVLYYDTVRGGNLLERSSSSVWSEALFEIPSPTAVRMVPAYVSHIKLSSDNFEELHGAKLSLTCTSSVTVLVNEQPMLIDSMAQLIETDIQGKIEIVNLTDGLQTPSFFINNAPGSKLLTDTLRIDPARHLKERMKEKTTADDLKALTVGSSSKKMFVESTNFDKLSSVLKDVYEELGKLPEDGTRLTGIDPLPDQDVKSWSLFHIVETAIDNIEDFAVQGGHLIVTVAGKIIGFVIDCFETALKAVNTIFTAAGAVLTDLQHWLGFVFDWEDIVKTHQSISTAFNFALSSSDESMEEAFKFMDSTLSSLEANFINREVLVDEFKGTTNNLIQLKKDVEQIKSGHPKDPPTGNHPAIDYILNKVSNLLKGSRIALQLDLDSNILGSIGSLLQDIEKPYQEFAKLAETVTSGIHLTFIRVIESLGGAVLTKLITMVRGILSAFKGCVMKLLRSMASVINIARDIPLLSAFYKYATGAPANPSFLDLTTLIIAIPVSITCQLAKCIPFPTFTKEILEMMFHSRQPLQTPIRENSDAIPDPTRLKTLYHSAVPYLKPWAKEQARTLGWIDMIQTTITTIWIAIPEILSMYGGDMEAEMPGTVSVDRFTLIKVILKGFGILASCPIIQPDQWESTTAPELRFQAWGVDAGLTLLEMVTACQAVNDAEAATRYKALVITRNVFAVFMWGRIAVSEHQSKGGDMTDEEFAKAQIRALWSVPEYLVLCASRIAPTVISPATPENVRGIVALATAGFGLAGNVSRWSRNEYQGECSRAFSAGTA